MDKARYRYTVFALLCMALLVLLVACGGGSSGGGTNPNLGTVEGSVSFDIVGNTNAQLLESWANTPFVPGQLIVSFHNEDALRA